MGESLTVQGWQQKLFLFWADLVFDPRMHADCYCWHNVPDAFALDCTFVKDFWQIITSFVLLKIGCFFKRQIRVSRGLYCSIADIAESFCEQKSIKCSSWWVIDFYGLDNFKETDPLCKLNRATGPKRWQLLIKSKNEQCFCYRRKQSLHH